MWRCNRRFCIEGERRKWRKCLMFNGKRAIECQRCSMSRYTTLTRRRRRCLLLSCRQKNLMTTRVSSTQHRCSLLVKLPMLIVTGEALCSILTHLGCP
jgi:hypothetical protein